MHFHLPKPLHGWREFVGEVGIIVLGVLIALGAEQIIDDIRWHQKVERTKAELNAELHDDELSAYRWLTDHRCMENALSAADQAVGRARDTGEVAPIAAYDPPLQLFTSDAWLNARSLEVADRMGPSAMRTYSRLYFFPSELQGNIVQLHQLASELKPLTYGLHHVSPDEAGEYQRSIARIRELQHRTEYAELLLLQRGKKAGIQLSREEMEVSVRRFRSIYGPCASPPDIDSPAPG